MKMALQLNGLDPSNSGSGGAALLGTYRTADDKATVLAAGYFNGAAGNLRWTKALLVSASDGMFIAAIESDGSAVVATEYDPSAGNVVTWDDIEDKPAVIAAGADQSAARAVIGAGTSSLELGTTAGTALAGDTPIPTQYTDAMAQSAIKGKSEIAALTSASTLEEVIAALQA